jgi:hypothetical protein
MNTKIEKISELSTLMNKNNAVGYDLLRLFGLFKLGNLLSRLSLEKQQGVRASDHGSLLIPYSFGKHLLGIQ